MIDYTDPTLCVERFEQPNTGFMVRSQDHFLLAQFWIDTAIGPVIWPYDGTPKRPMTDAEAANLIAKLLILQ